jgi:hypothetical protein
MVARTMAVVSLIVAAVSLASDSHRPLSELPWQREALGFRMDAVVIHSAYAYAEPIIAKVVITNSNDKPTKFVTHLSPTLWQVRGHDQLGDPIEVARYGRFVLGELPLEPRAGRMDIETMMPGQTRTFYVPLNALADLTMQATYTMEISLPFNDATGTDAILCSGPLVFQVSDWGGAATREAILEFSRQEPTAEVARQLGEEMKSDLEELISYTKEHQPPALRSEARSQLQKLSDIIGGALSIPLSPETKSQ